MSTIQKTEIIHVLDKGDIIESGKHGELLAKNGVNKKLYELQQLANN